MMHRGVMFAVIIGKVSVSWAPVNDKLPLVLAVLDPIKFHVDRFGHFLFYGFVCKTDGCRVVYREGGRRLWVAHFFEAYTYGEYLPSVDVASPYFGLCRGSHHVFNDFTYDVDGTVEGGVRIFGVWLGSGAEEEVAACSATCFGNGQVRSIAMRM